MSSAVTPPAGAIGGVAIGLSAVLVLSACGAGGHELVTRRPGSGVMPHGPGVDVPGSRTRLEAGQAEVRAVLEEELGPGGWHVDRPAQEVACPPGTAPTPSGKLYPAEYSRPEVLDSATWRRVWAGVLQRVSSLGFRSAPGEGERDALRLQQGARYGYLVDADGDHLTVHTAPGLGTGYGGFGACHPW